MVKEENLVFEWLVMIFVPSIILILGEELIRISKEVNLIFAIFVAAIVVVLYLAELYSLIRRTLEKFGIKI